MNKPSLNTQISLFDGFSQQIGIKPLHKTNNALKRLKNKDYLCKLINKHKVMKKLTFIILSWILYVNSSDPYPEPVYYAVQYDDVTVKYSRALYYDIYGTKERVDENLQKRFNDKSRKDIIFLTSKQIMIDNRKVWRYKMDSILQSMVKQ